MSSAVLNGRITRTCERCGGPCGNTVLWCEACVAARDRQRNEDRREKLSPRPCVECGATFTPEPQCGGRATTCTTCKTRRAFAASLKLQHRPIEESDYAQGLAPLVEAWERDLEVLSAGDVPEVDGPAARDLLALCVEGPIRLSALSSSLQRVPVRSLVERLEARGWVETERIKLGESRSPRSALFVALPPGQIPPPLLEALLPGKTTPATGGAEGASEAASGSSTGTASDPDPGPAPVPDVDHREEIDDRRVLEELRRRRWDLGTWRRHTTNATAKEGNMAKRATPTWDPKDCSECGEEFTPVGKGQGRRGKCYECAPPKGGKPPKPRPRPRKPEPELEPEEDEEGEELDELEEGSELEETEGLEEGVALDVRGALRDLASAGMAQGELVEGRAPASSEVRERLGGLGRAAGLLGLSLLRRGLDVLEEQLGG